MTGDYDYRSALIGVTVRKVNGKFFIADCEEPEYALTKRQLFLALKRICGTEAEEVAFMLLDAKENPSYSEFHFGVNGLYIYGKQSL